MQTVNWNNANPKSGLHSSCINILSIKCLMADLNVMLTVNLIFCLMDTIFFSQDVKSSVNYFFNTFTIHSTKHSEGNHSEAKSLHLKSHSPFTDIISIVSC